MCGYALNTLQEHFVRGPSMTLDLEPSTEPKSGWILRAGGHSRHCKRWLSWDVWNQNSSTTRRESAACSSIQAGHVIAKKAVRHFFFRLCILRIDRILRQTLHSHSVSAAARANIYLGVSFSSFFFHTTMSIHKFVSKMMRWWGTMATTSTTKGKGMNTRKEKFSLFLLSVCVWTAYVHTLSK